MKNRIIMLVNVFFFVLCLSACKSKSAENDTKQLIEVTNADGEIVRQVTEEDIITELTKNEKIEEWEDIAFVPDGAKKRYVFTTYALITDQEFQNSDEPEITVEQEILYFDGADYYLEAFSNETAEVMIDKIPKAAGEYLLKFADEKSAIEDRNKIISAWGIDTREIPDVFIFGEYEESEESEDEEDYDKYPYQDVETFSDSDLKKVSKYQKIEISLDDDIVFSTTDLSVIADILNHADMPHWESVDHVPDDASLSYVLIRNAHPKKTSGSNVVEIERWEIYKEQSNYYLHSIIAGDESGEKEYYILPEESGIYLDNLLEN